MRDGPLISRVVVGSLAFTAGCFLTWLSASAYFDDDVRQQLPRHRTTTTLSSRPPSTTSPWTVPDDPRLLTAADLGHHFEAAPFDGHYGSGPCRLTDPVEPTPVERLGVAFVSNAAQELLSVELLVHEDADAARAWFRASRLESECEIGENETPKSAHPLGGIALEGADEAFSIGFVSESGSIGYVVARDSERVVIVEVQLHFGVVTEDVVEGTEVASRALARARPRPPSTTSTTTSAPIPPTLPPIIPTTTSTTAPPSPTAPPLTLLPLGGAPRP